MRVAVLTGRQLPRFITWEIPDLEQLFSEDRLLIAGLQQAGVEVEHVVWSDPSIEWNDFDLAIIRTTWDYIDHPRLFLDVLAAIERSGCVLANPLDAVRWNGHKSYLLDLQTRGIPVIPTHRITGSDTADLHAMVAREGWTKAVVKPAIGGGAADISFVESRELASTLDRLAADRPGEEFLLQPLMSSIVTEGEWSFVFIAGAFSHALLKKPASGDYRVHGMYGGSIARADPDEGDLARALDIHSRLPFDLLYSRLDLVRTADGLAVMEVELIEPFLYFEIAPEAVGRLIEAVIRKLQESPRRTQ